MTRVHVSVLRFECFELVQAGQEERIPILKNIMIVKTMQSKNTREFFVAESKTFIIATN